MQEFQNVEYPGTRVVTLVEPNRVTIFPSRAALALHHLKVALLAYPHCTQVRDFAVNLQVACQFEEETV